ncbi:MAG TPA: hypothetical protein VF618_13555 [Thermoanaerobaculia bacterium]
MIRKTESDAPRHATREAAGSPPPLPSDEELLAYSNGELPPDRAARVREALAHYPDLAQALAQPFPEEVKPDDPDYLPPDELARQWERLRRDVHAGARPPEGKVLQFWRTTTALAAMLALVFGGLLWRARSELGEPQANEAIEFQNRRGAPVVPAIASGRRVTLTVPVAPDYEQYQVELRGAAAPWRSRRLPHPAGDSLAVTIPHNLPPGQYEVVLYGIRGETVEQVGTHTFIVRAS